MSKATFYEHFANKEECMMALFDLAARVLQRVDGRGRGRRARRRARADARPATRAFLTALADHPEFAQTLLVEIIGAGPRAAQQRDRILQTFADLLDAENAAAARRGLIGRFASRDDAFAVIGAAVELVSRQVRLGDAPATCSSWRP